MITNAYSIYDKKALVYYTPWFQPTHGAAMRIMADLVNDSNTQIGRHPADYTLYHIGTYDDSKGELTKLSPLVHIRDGASLVNHQAEMFPSLIDKDSLPVQGATK